MELTSPIDAAFLIGESREHPMHVGSMQLFEPPEGSGPDFVRRLHDTMLAERELHPTFRKRPATLFGSPQLAWSRDDEVDLEYHLRRWALPDPGRVEDALDMASRLHGGLLDRHRPLWELHLIEGLADGRFAVYSKMHHALIDGVSAQRLLRRTLTSDASSTQVRVPWHLPRRQRRPRTDSGSNTVARNLLSAAASGPALMRVARSALVQQQLTLPFAAPRTMLNVPIGGARRCVAGSWSLQRLEQVKKATGSTINDVVLAMSSGALRGYLAERDALPDKPLIAMVPISLRPADDDGDGGGNKVGAILCNLATDIADPIERLRVIGESMRRSKQVYAGLSSTQSIALSALMVSPLALSLLPGLVSMTSPAFNIVISNVPGPRESMFWGGARLDAAYPMSIPLDGQAVNITLTTTADNLDFGIVGCRRSVPQLSRLLIHLEDALAALEDAAR
ncbi:WS/DGAT/MGAT family O-acyltransferase [Nocardia cyriacigeorgica]|uniref:WS/DGAT/MGAT family O-acyltransferase n=1 Tax=Nocardia cyriacigeorgica TaxID=135487 RepID=UPI0024547C63|nr:wax ester/triacylglycerol synthase family O-acyltransferase [Nocardia cyriacigeorgica]